MKHAVPNAARLRITLKGITPVIWREVEVPLSMTLWGLHETIQGAFQWFDCHLWEFNVHNERFGIPREEDIRFETEEVKNADDFSLSKLHDYQVSQFIYTYDFGDNWVHKITVMEYFEMSKGACLPAFVKGKRQAPPEDVGGEPGFEMFLEAMADPANEEHEELVEWYGRTFDPDDIQIKNIKLAMRRLAN